MPGGTVNEANVLLLKIRMPPLEVLVDTVKEPKVRPPPLNCLSAVVVALYTIGAVKSDVASRLVVVPTSNRAPALVLV